MPIGPPQVQYFATCQRFRNREQDIVRAFSEWCILRKLDGKLSTVLIVCFQSTNYIFSVLITYALAWLELTSTHNYLSKKERRA